MDHSFQKNSTDVEKQTRILLIEDDIAISDIYRIKLEKEGFLVRICTNGLDAISIAGDYKPDLVLMDIMMPTMDGFETLRVMRELMPSIKMKIVMFSNLSSKNDIDRCMALGADDYIIKANSTPKEAISRLRAILAKWHTETLTIPEDAVRIENISQDKSRLIFLCPHCSKETSIIIPRVWA